MYLIPTPYSPRRKTVRDHGYIRIGLWESYSVFCEWRLILGKPEAQVQGCLCLNLHSGTNFCRLPECRALLCRMRKSPLPERWPPRLQTASHIHLRGMLPYSSGRRWTAREYHVSGTFGCIPHFISLAWVTASMSKYCLQSRINLYFDGAAHC